MNDVMLVIFGVPMLVVLGFGLWQFKEKMRVAVALMLFIAGIASVRMFAT